MMKHSDWPVGKIAEKAVWYFECRINKNALFQTVFGHWEGLENPNKTRRIWWEVIMKIRKRRTEKEEEDPLITRFLSTPLLSHSLSDDS